MSTWGIAQENGVIEMRRIGTPTSFRPASETETRQKMDRTSIDLSTGENDFENVALRFVLHRFYAHQNYSDVIYLTTQGPHLLKACHPLQK